MPNYPEAVTRTNWDKHGERPSLKDFGAKGDLQYFTASVTVASDLVTSLFTLKTGVVDILGITVTGTGTRFLTEVQVGQFIKVGTEYGKVLRIEDDLTIVLTSGFSTAPVGQPYSSGTGFISTDIGKRMVLYGGGSGTARSSFLTGTAVAVPTIDTYTTTAAIDCLTATTVKFAANCFPNDITWEVFGANAGDYSDEVLLSGPTNVTERAASSIFVISSPTKRYYRVKVKNKTAGQNSIAYITCVALGRMIGASILAVLSPEIAQMSTTAAATRDSLYAYFGTDDTLAIQQAFDVLTSRVPPFTADGGTTVEAAAQGKYLISSPIFHRHMVTLKGHSGGGAIFQVDGESFPADTAVWNMSGTFQIDSRIAFYTRLEDVRIDCGHVPGSIGIYCDALQENSGLYRVSVIQWTKYGVQACTDTDRYGCINWIVQDPWIYPSNTAFADDTCRGFISNYALYITFIRGTYLGQGGFICGYGKGIDVSNGTVNAVGQIHFECCRVGFHFNVGSGGNLAGMSTQPYVQIAVQVSGGNPTHLRSISTASQTSVQNTLTGYSSAKLFVPAYDFAPNDNPHILDGPVQTGGDQSLANILTQSILNFGGDDQGGWRSVNSRPENFPNWVKTSTNASNNAAFYRENAQGLEIRVGPATQPVYVATGVCDVVGTAVTRVSGSLFDVSWPVGSQIIFNGSTVALIAAVPTTGTITLQGSGAGTLTGATFGVSTDVAAFGGTNPGTRYLLVKKDVGIQTPHIYFDLAAEGPTGFGNTLDVNRARWVHGQAGQTILSVQRSVDSGATFTDDLIRFMLDIGATQLYHLFFDGVTALNFGNNYTVNRARWTHSGGSQELLTLESSVDSGASWSQIVQFILDSGLIAIIGTMKFPALTPGPLKLDIDQLVISGLISLTAEVTGTLPIANGGTGATTAGGARTNLGVPAAASTYSKSEVDTLIAGLQSQINTNNTDIGNLASTKADHGPYVDSNGDTVTI